MWGLYTNDVSWKESVDRDNLNLGIGSWQIGKQLRVELALDDI